MNDTTDPAPQAPASKGLSPRLQSSALWAEIIGALAIVISLIFVGIQIRSNTQAIRGASAYEINRWYAQINVDASQDGNHALLVRKLHDPTNRVEDFSEEERARADLYILGIVQAQWAQFSLYREGSLAREDWEVHGKWAAEFRDLPLVKRYYDNLIAANQHAPDFIAELDRLEAQIDAEGRRLTDYAPVGTAEEADTGGEE
ncbi:MAG: hypothetical protein AAF687_09270 [Pseudomonadota bacterium]